MQVNDPILRPRPFGTGIIPKLLEAYLIRTARLESEGTEANIPQQGPLVALFAPHAGWIEPVAVDECFRRVARACPIWVTKKENRAIPPILVGGRVLCMDRERPEPSIVKTVYAILGQPNAALATAIEGTRFGNPQDPQDLCTLGPFKAGMVRIAIKARVPILPIIILGADKISPWLDQVWQKQGTLAAFRTIRRLRTHPQPVEIRFLPAYHDHLQEDTHLWGKRLRKRSAFHTSKLGRMFAAKILELRPDYPLGALDDEDSRV